MGRTTGTVKGQPRPRRQLLACMSARKSVPKTRKRRADVSTSDSKPSKTAKTSQTPQQSPQMNRLSANFFGNKSCVELSRALLGQTLCRRPSPDGPVLRGRIVETEAYLGAEDKASATYNGRRTERLEPLYMSGGTCFVYFTYGMYYCMNLSVAGDGQAVLLRAVQPLEGLEAMQRLRAKSRKTKTDKPFADKMLANGPSKLCMAFDINKDNVNKEDITDSTLIWLESGDAVPDEDIVCAKRVGIDRAPKEWANKLLRFYIKDNEFISQK